MLDKSGNPWTDYPILEFEIKNGPPNHLIDVQVARRHSNALSGGPGLPGAWDKSKSPKDRLWQRAFSSWSNGETSLKLDDKGEATYKMPLDWWKDLARIPWRKFVTTKMYHRVLAFPDAAAKSIVYSTEDGQDASAPHVPIHNNLKDFRVVDLGYVAGGVRKAARVQFTVREAHTTDMYTIVQWMQGSFRMWGGPDTYASHSLYAITHEGNFPDWTVDSLTTNPRPSFFGGGAGPNVSADGRTARGTDEPGGAMFAGYTHDYTLLDFETRVHLNFEVPATVTITRQDGSPPVYGVITGVIAPPEPLVLDSETWEARILQVRDTTGSVTVSHPDTFAGP